MKDGFNVIIRRNDISSGVDIFFLDRQGREVMLARPVELVFETYEMGTPSPKPTLELDAWKAEEFLRAFAEALDERGVKTDSDAKIAGTLEATRGHLADMRRLVFKDV